MANPKFTPMIRTFGSVVCGLTLFWTRVLDVDAHGRMLEPPSRASMWRVGFNTPENYNDHELNCGGFANQFFVNDGLCGPCGDPWQGPREHEPGGKYFQGVITRRYRPGDVMDVTLEITASHLGYFEFRLCPNNDRTNAVTQECLNQYLLEIVDSPYGTKYFDEIRRIYNFQVRLPAGLTCTQCVVQWRYHTGNRWGCFSPNWRDCCVGCGSDQEEFYACADIAILADVNIPDTTRTVTTVASTATTEVTTASDGDGGNNFEPDEFDENGIPRVTTCIGTGAWQYDLKTDEWCSYNCAADYCPPTHCLCDDSKLTFDTGLLGSGRRCAAVGAWEGYDHTDDWCIANCPEGLCPPDLCSCIPI